MSTLLALVVGKRNQERTNSFPFRAAAAGLKKAARESQQFSNLANSGRGMGMHVLYFNEAQTQG